MFGDRYSEEHLSLNLKGQVLNYKVYSVAKMGGKSSEKSVEKMKMVVGRFDDTYMFILSAGLPISLRF